MSFSDKYVLYKKDITKNQHLKKRNNKMIIKIVLSTVAIISQLHLLHAGNKGNKGLDDLNYSS